MSVIAEIPTPKGVHDCPNAERFAKELERIDVIELFKPKEEPNLFKLQELANQHLERLNLQEAPIRIIRDDWSLAEDAELDALCDAKFDAKCIAVQFAVGWKTTKHSSRDTAEHAGWHTSRVEARDASVLDEIWDVVSNKTRGVEIVGDVVGDMAGNAAWIITEDKMAETGYAKGNPFSSLIDIYELGCWPIGLVDNADGQKEFVIFIPPIQKAT